MSVLERFIGSQDSETEGPAISAISAISSCATRVNSTVSTNSSHAVPAEAVASFAEETPTSEHPVEAREHRFSQVRKMMAEDDKPRTYYFWPDTGSSKDYVIVACAKRGVAEWEMTIERDKWDPWLFLEMLEKIQ